MPILKDICYGNGYTVIKGKMEQTGGCFKSFKPPVKRPKIPKSADHPDQTSFDGICMKKKGSIFISKPKDLEISVGGMNLNNIRGISPVTDTKPEDPIEKLNYDRHLAKEAAKIQSEMFGNRIGMKDHLANVNPLSFIQSKQGKPTSDLDIPD